jgi:hypothetical protein
MSRTAAHAAAEWVSGRQAGGVSRAEATEVALPIATLSDAVRRALLLGSAEDGEEPPPLLLSAQPPPRVDAFCGVHDAPEGHAAGAWPALNWGDELQCVGAGVLDAGLGGACAPLPALLLAFPREPEPRLALYVPDAPVAALELALCDARASASPLERRLWTDPGEADDRIDRRREIGAHVRGVGAAAYSSQVLTGAYHVLRSGPAAFLRLRAPKAQGEREALALALRVTLGPEKAHAPFAPLSEVLPPPYELCTVFQASGRGVDAETAFELARGAELTASNHATHPEDARAPDVAAEALLQRSLPARPAQRQQSPPAAPTREPLEAAPQLPTLARLMGQLSALASVRRLGEGREGVKAAFAPCDQLWCTRALGLGREESGGAGLVPLVTVVAKRVAAPAAVLLVRVGPDEAITHAALLNADFELQPSVDAIVRLLACPWVCPLLVHAARADLCTVDVNGLRRDALQLTVQVRNGFVAAPAAPPATSGELAALRTAIEARLAAPAEASAEAPAPAPALAALRAAEPMLARMVVRSVR